MLYSKSHGHKPIFWSFVRSRSARNRSKLLNGIASFAAVLPGFADCYSAWQKLVVFAGAEPHTGFPVKLLYMERKDEK